MSIDARNEVKERVREAVDIVDLVGSYLPLRNQGRDMVGLCPWHDDSKPSLTVSPSRQSYKCFVCDIGGDIFSFVMQIEGVTFPEALEMLAERAGVPLPKAGATVKPGNPNEKKLLLAAMQWAAEQYHRFLVEGREAQGARDYLESRHISQESVQRFMIGYAPNQWDWLLGRASGTPYSPAVLEKIGVLKPRSEGSGHYDTYRGRVLFTIRDCSNNDARPIGLGGRILPEFADDASPKYINSPETPLFSKSRQLYGFDIARDAVRKQKNVLVMEGYTDCVIAQQFGVSNAIAVLGTALGEQHIRFLKRFCDTITLVLDGDKAGQDRSAEIVKLFMAAQVDLKILTLPQDLDPCDFLVSHGSEAFAQLLTNAVDALEFKIRAVTKGLDLRVETHRAHQALEDVLGTLASAPRLSTSTPASFQLREHQVLARLARQFAVSEEELRTRLRELRTGARRPTSPTPSVEAARYELADLDAWDREVLELILSQPDALAQVEETIAAADLVSPLGSRIYAKCLELHRAGKSPGYDQLMLEAEDLGMKDFLVRLDEQGRAKCESSLAQRIDDILRSFRRRKEDQHHQQTIAALQQGAMGEGESEAALADLFTNLRARHGKSARTDG